MVNKVMFIKIYEKINSWRFECSMDRTNGYDFILINHIKWRALDTCSFQAESWTAKIKSVTVFIGALSSRSEIAIVSKVMIH